MDDVQLISELIQPGDFGMLVDLKGAYLTLGLHPSHRKYCRFRDPVTRQRLQWRTVSFGISEAPRLCTKLLRPLRAPDFHVRATRPKKRKKIKKMKKNKNVQKKGNDTLKV